MYCVFTELNTDKKYILCAHTTHLLYPDAVVWVTKTRGEFQQTFLMFVKCEYQIEFSWIDQCCKTYIYCLKRYMQRHLKTDQKVVACLTFTTLQIGWECMSVGLMSESEPPLLQPRRLAEIACLLVWCLSQDLCWNSGSSSSCWYRVCLHNIQHSKTF